MSYEYVVVKVVETFITDEGFEVRLELLVKDTGTFMYNFLRSEYLWIYSLVKSKSIVEALPDTTELSERAKKRSSDFIEVVIEGVRKLNETTFLTFDSKLNLAQHISVFDVDQNIISSFLQSIDYSDKVNVTFFTLALSDDLVINPDDLFLAWSTFTSEKVHNLQSHDRKINLQCGIMLFKFSARCQKTMNQSI